MLRSDPDESFRPYDTTLARPLYGDPDTKSVRKLLGLTSKTWTHDDASVDAVDMPSAPSTYPRQLVFFLMNCMEYTKF